MLRAAQLDPLNPVSRRDSKKDRAHPLHEPSQPIRDLRLSDLLVGQLEAVLDWLNVEQSERYLPEGKETHCDIYAADVAYLAQVYLPRVWWCPPALQQLELGKDVREVLGVTVIEANANELHEWLGEHGPFFGWHRSSSFDEVQDRANQGFVGLVTALRKDRSRPGHIVVVVPETSGCPARRDEGHVIAPVYSQSGEQNFRRGHESFWKEDAYSEFASWWHP